MYNFEVTTTKYCSIELDHHDFVFVYFSQSELDLSSAQQVIFQPFEESLKTVGNGFKIILKLRHSLNMSVHSGCELKLFM